MGVTANELRLTLKHIKTQVMAEGGDPEKYAAFDRAIALPDDVLNDLAFLVQMAPVIMYAYGFAHGFGTAFATWAQPDQDTMH